MKRRSWSKEQLISAVKKSTSVRQVLSKIGLREAGGNYDQVKKYIRELNLNTDHFRGMAWNKGLKGILSKPAIPLEQILVGDSTFQSYKLKQRLFGSGLKPKYCEECKWAITTPDGYLPLELHHIDGDRHNNRLENLKILCPNCHSLKETHRGRNRKKKKTPGW